MAVVLDAPILFQLTPGDGSVTLNFYLPEGSSFTDVLYETNNNEYLSLGATSGPITITKQSDGATDFVNGDTYSIQLIGVSDEYPEADDTLFSLTQKFSPVAAPKAPDAPQLQSFTPADQSINLNYVLGDNGGSPVTGVFYTTDGGVTFAELSGAIDGNATITTLSDGVTPIENDTQVVIQIVAVNAVEPLPADNLVTKTILATPALVTTPADSPNILGYTPGDAKLNVTYELGSNGGSDFISVYYSTDNGATWKDSGATTGVAQILIQSDESGPVVNGDVYSVRLLVTTVDYLEVNPNINIPSSRVDMKPIAASVAPDAPTLGSWEAGDQTLTVIYELGSNGGSPVTNVYYTTDNGTTWKDTGSIYGNAIITELSTVGTTPLTNGTGYLVRLVAITVDFTDEMANPASLPVLIMTPSSSIVRPSVVSIDSVESGDAILSVSYSVQFTGGSPINKIYYSTDGGNSWKDSGSTTGYFAITTRSDIESALENGTTYYLLLVASTVQYPDYQNNPIPLVATPATLLAQGTPAVEPSAPNIGKVLVGDATFTLVYTILSDGGSAITNVLYSTDGGTTWYTTGESYPFGTAIITTESDGSTPLVNGDPGYFVQLVAVTDMFPTTSNPQSAVLNVKPTATSVAPDAPTIGTTSAGDATIQIEYVLCSDGGSIVTDVLFSTNGGVNWRTIGDNSGTAILTTDSQGNPLVNGTPYVIRLVAVTEDFADPAVNPVSTDVVITPTLEGTVPPDAPTIQGYSPGDGLVQVFFTLGSVGSGTLLGVSYSTNGTTWADSSVTSGSFAMKFDSDGNQLVNDQTYSVRIVVITSDYLDPRLNTPSDIVPMTPLGAPTAPDAPTILGFSPGDTTLRVTYRLGSNGGSYFTNIWYSTNDGGDWQTLNVGPNISTSTFGTISFLSTDGTTPLTNGVTYTVRLMATTNQFPDPINTPSEPVDMTPSDMTQSPSAPVITSWFGIDGALVVRYTILSDGGSPITAVYYSTDGGLSWERTRAPNGTAVITITSGGSGPIVDSTTYGVRLVAVTIDFPNLSNRFSSTVYMVARPTLPGTFKPKGMSYTEFLRSKKADRVKIIDTKPVRTASEITNARRLAASTVFALNNEAVKGSITTPIDFSQGGLHAARSYYKQGGGGRRVGSASEFTAFSGSQAIGGLVQAGLPPTRLVQQSNFILVSAPVSQGVSDYLRRDQGVKVSLGQQHNLEEVTPPVFVDNTIRNTGSPATVTRPAIHEIKAKNAFAYVPNRPSQAEGQYALKGDREPGKELGAVGGNPHYKAGAALKNIPYVEKHHGNDLGVNPKRQFVRYQIPKGTPAHLKINRPKTIGGYVAPPPPPPGITLSDIARITAPGEYTLNASTVIPVGYVLTIPAGITLKIPVGPVLTNNGTIICDGTINNDGMTNNGTFIITSSGAFVTTVLFTNSIGATVTNSGAFTVTTAGAIINRGTITNTSSGTITNNHTFANNVSGAVINAGTITISSTGSVTNAGAITNNSVGTVTINGTITNSVGGILTNNSAITINQSAGALTNSGTVRNNAAGTIVNNDTVTNNIGATIQNIGTFTNILGSTFTNNGTLTNTGTFSTFVALSTYAALVSTTYTLTGSPTIPSTTSVTLPSGFTLVIPETQTLTNNGQLILQSTSGTSISGTVVNAGTVTSAGNVDIVGTGTFTNNNIFTSSNTLNNNGTFTNNSPAIINNSGDFTNYDNSTFTNNGTLTNTGSFTTYVPISNYATLAGGSTYILDGPQTISSTTGVTVPVGFTLVIPQSITFRLNGTLTNNSTITINTNGNINCTNGRITNNIDAVININGQIVTSGINALLVNNGTINVNGSGHQLFNANGTFANNGTINILNGAVWYPSAPTVNNVGGIITVDTVSTIYTQNRPFINHGTITNANDMSIHSNLINDGTIENTDTSTFNLNTSILYNYGGGVVNTSGTINAGDGTVNNADGGGACGSGTLGGTNPLTPDGTECPP